MSNEQPRDSKGRFLSHGLMGDGLADAISALHAALDHGTVEEIEQYSRTLVVALGRSAGATPDEAKSLGLVIAHRAREMIPTSDWFSIERAAANASPSTEAIRSEINHRRLTARASRSHRKR